MTYNQNDSLWEEYGWWMLDEVRFDGRNLSRLIAYLNRTPFYFMSYVPMDENRLIDGLDNRDRFFYYNPTKVDKNGEFDDNECTVLEMLIALALRIETEIIGRSEEEPCFIFGEMLYNLSLDKYTDRYFIESDVARRVSKWLNREIEYDGRGGLFPLKYPKKDQRTLEIWHQMNAYLIENQY